jgi:probable F420-dependent oxidoreductase
MDLGRVGVWTSYRAIGEENAGEAASLVEQLGFGTFWLGGSPRLPAVRPLLEATERLVVATGIVNVWANDPAELAAEYASLEAEFPGRLLLGIGIGHPEATSDYTKPLQTMRAFYDGLDAASVPVPRERRCQAALGDKMLALSAERGLGAHSYFVPVEHTRTARRLLGEGPLLAPELACAVDDDDARGRAAARGYARLYLGLSNYTNNLRRFGFTDDDIAGLGSDRLIDSVVPHGTADQIAAAVRAHHDAGADHVCLQPVGARGVPREQWTALARALIGRRARS